MEKINDRLYNWASILESGARQQAVNTSSMPFVFPHVALMPDAHWGMGATVGSVIPTERAIIPAAVGVDIGCGMIARRLDITGHDLDVPGRRTLPVLHKRIADRIPLSAGGYNRRLYDARTSGLVDELERTDGVETAERVAPNWRLQLGSLGSGNHFIEVCLDEDDHVWLFLHSGSRGVGNKIAQHHIKVAKRRCESERVSLPDKDLAYLVEGTDEFWSYIRDLRWAQHFALLNRVEMMNRVRDAFDSWVAPAGPAGVLQEVNCHHNYTEQERHFGREVWLSRKGAIDASEGAWGLIPGSMGAASYVVVGKGNPLSLSSSPHGAGRNHSRTAARKLFTKEDLDRRMSGIAWGDSAAFLDEHPDAYKSIDVVMRDAADLVEIRHELRQIVNVKGA